MSRLVDADVPGAKVLKALTIWQPWASLCVIPRPCDACTPHRPSSTVIDDCPDCKNCRPFKTIETRSWPAPKSLIGQRIAIHAAAKSPPHALSVGGFEVNRPRGAKPCLMDFNDDGRTWTPRTHVLPLPLGTVVGTAVLADCVPMVGCASDEHNGQRRIFVCIDDLWITAESGPPRRIDDQLPFGHFEPGRWAWLLADVERFDEPIPATGRQGIWNWERP